MTDKLAGQATGEFYLVRESSVTAVRSDESFMRTEQMPENEIAELARLALTTHLKSDVAIGSG